MGFPTKKTYSPSLSQKHTYTQTSYNLLGGYVEFQMDTTEATAATNTNFYTSSPDKCCSYCDIQKNKSPQCMEMVRKYECCINCMLEPANTS